MHRLTPPPPEQRLLTPTISVGSLGEARRREALKEFRLTGMYLMRKPILDNLEADRWREEETDV